MLDRTNIPVRISAISPRLMQKDEMEVNLLDLKLEINPFTPELASELDDFVKRTLFTSQDATVTPKLAGAAFNLTLPPQEIVVRSAPDQSKPTFHILEGKIGTLHAKRSKKTSSWRLVFNVKCSPASKDQLAAIMDAYTKTRYCTFADATPDLFQEIAKEEKAARKAIAQEIQNELQDLDGEVVSTH